MFITYQAELVRSHNPSRLRLISMRVWQFDVVKKLILI